MKKKLTIIGFIIIAFFIILVVLFDSIFPDSYREHIEVLIVNGNEFYYLGKYQEAMNMYDRVLELKPNNVDALGNKGIVLDEIGEYKEAIRWYDKALEIEPNFINALYNKGVALSNLGKHQDAKEVDNKILKIEEANELYNKEFKELYNKEFKELYNKEFKELYNKEFKELYNNAQIDSSNVNTLNDKRISQYNKIETKIPENDELWHNLKFLFCFMRRMQTPTALEICVW